MGRGRADEYTATMALILPYHDQHPEVAAGAFVAQSATLVGDVQVGAQSSVWFGAVLRGDLLPIRVGARTSIQDNSVLHTSTGRVPVVVGDDVTVGHAVLLHGGTVEDRVILGMGSIVLDGAHIGADTILGAGSLVTENKRIPSGVLAMGRPAKVVRELRPEEVASILVSAQGYVEKTEAYLRMRG
jgi:carbonic anhydrase/acetyltransferase-like protein (isoleucine patch superfamily)